MTAIPATGARESIEGIEAILLERLGSLSLEQKVRLPPRQRGRAAHPLAGRFATAPAYSDQRLTTEITVAATTQNRR